MKEVNYIRFTDNTAVVFHNVDAAVVAAMYNYKTPHSAGLLSTKFSLTKDDVSKTIDMFQKNKDFLLKYRNEIRSAAHKSYIHDLENSIDKVHGPADTLGVGFKDDDASFFVGKKWKDAGGSFPLFEMEPPEVETLAPEMEIQ